MNNVQMLKDGQEADVEVSWEDQQKINRFSILNTIIADREAVAEATRIELEAVEDAATELELTMEDDLLDDLGEDDDVDLDDKEDGGDQKLGSGGKANISYRIGDAFFMITADEAKAMLDAEAEALKKKNARFQSDMAGIQGEMGGLKKALYARFRDSIQLERD